VVDTSGHPVAGASVAIDRNLLTDSVGVLPLFEGDSAMAFATSDGAGRFVLRSATTVGAIVAQLGDRRAIPAVPADRVRLVLEPTRSVRGVVDLAGLPYSAIVVVCDPADEPTGSFHQLTPVGPDGSFALTGVTVRSIRVGVGTRNSLGDSEQVVFRTLPASPAPVTDLRLSLPSSHRTLDIIARSATATALESVEIIVLAGKHTIRHADQLRRLDAAGGQVAYGRPTTGESVSPAVKAALQPGDFIAHLAHAGTGDLTICAYAIAADLADHEARKRLAAQFANIAFRCEQIGPDAPQVVVTVPPPRRLD
jgi:hypothetical protein